ncbi:unnamed protein product [Mucor fragilis]
MDLVCGEKSLRCAAKRTNKKLYDEERRASGPNIDIIFRDVVNNEDLAILELSGPINKANHTHFLEDQNKIAVNSKHTLKTLINSVPPCYIHFRFMMESFTSIASTPTIKITIFSIWSMNSKFLLMQTS